MILTAIAHTVRDLGVAFLISAAAFVLLFAIGLLATFFIADARGKPAAYEPSSEFDPADLDDWLAKEEPLEEFKVWDRDDTRAAA